MMSFRSLFGLLILGISIASAGEMTFNSQASQDQFVYNLLYNMLDKQDQGFYLEIGAGEPVHINNSYFFETNLGWQGTSIDISSDLSERWHAVRRGALLIEDATKSDYRAILRAYPRIIDYLSLDVDGFYTDVLERIPFDSHVFKMITIEHDAYRYGDLYRLKERKILSSHGYHLLCADVSSHGCPFEDWWIHPGFFPPDLFSTLKSLDLNGKDHAQVLESIKLLNSAQRR